MVCICAQLKSIASCNQTVLHTKLDRMIDITYLVSYFNDSRGVLLVLVCRYLHYLMNTVGLTQISVTKLTR